MKAPARLGKILLPKSNVDLNKWAVVACDQHTSNPKYWEDLKEYTKDSYSTLNLIYPECYLSGDKEKDEAFAKAIAENMHKYTAENIFNEYCGMVYVERSNLSGDVRKGIVLAVDLEHYSYKFEDKALIRASEGTVIERLPPRVAVREKCSLELPHIMLLFDDEKNEVICAQENSLPLYNFELNAGGGHIKGELLKNPKKVIKKLNALQKASVKKYGEKMLFAVGDGNHSLACAKQVYENEKANGKDTTLSRYALVEIVNIYDTALKFEPIHRVVFNTDNDNFIKKLREATAEFPHNYNVFTTSSQYEIHLPEDSIAAIEFIENFITAYVKENGGNIEYIHGGNELKEVVKSKNGTGIILQKINKSELFPYVVKRGALPKKTFSMGEAPDKRYYVEARKIKQ